MVSKPPIRKFSINVLPKILVASSRRCCPRRIDTIEEAPAPTIEPKADNKFITGMTKARPAIAMGPTALPMNMRSTTL
ncbi:MAG: hypothetical protein BWX77_00740 [Bacteroidetes bacterium ADurb.Bin090]|nr:MAG: hypothetical protein BWX77_00740 [Bacteroidetes bacterium ADurb.Bin090]